MQNFTESVVAATGLDSLKAKTAIGHVLQLLCDKTPKGHVAQFVETTPEAREAVAQAASCEDGGPTKNAETSTSFVGFGRADLNLLAGKLIRLGLTETQITKLLDETLFRSEDLFGAAGVREVRESLTAAGEPLRSSAVRPQQTECVAETPRSESTAAEAHKYWARETLGVFDDEDALETAVDELCVAGFGTAAISVLAADSKTEGGVARMFHDVKEIEDDGDAPQSDFVSSHSRAEGTAALIGAPLYVGGAAGLWAVFATGGSLTLAIASAIALGSLGACIGALLAGAVRREHMERVKQQLKLGGLVLWVNTPDSESESRATGILRKLGARDVHVHEVQREWSFKSIPFADGPFDPFVGLFKRSPHESRGA